MRSGLSLVATLAVAVGCGGAPTYEDGLPAPPARGEWLAIEPGGETICARGTPFRFFVRGGDPRKVIVDFQGGGACWDERTCAFIGALFNDRAGTLAEFTAAIDAGAVGGIFDPNRGEFADWTIVHVPYCTGDIHWGNARVEYGGGVTIEHRGFVNANAALDYVYSRFPSPQNLLVSGCSAGAYGAALHSAYIAQHYPSAQIAVLADSGAGIITESFLADSLPNWNAEAALPPFIPSLQRPLTELGLPDLYIGIGRAFPSMRLAQTATAFDQDQIFFFTAMGGRESDWPTLYRQSLARIDAELDNFTAYVPPGSMHCVTPYPFFHEREVNGVRLADWTTQLATGDSLPATQACQGAECCSDPVCDACRANGSNSWCRFCNSWPPPWSECGGE